MQKGWDQERRAKIESEARPGHADDLSGKARILPEDLQKEHSCADPF